MCCVNTNRPDLPQSVLVPKENKVRIALKNDVKKLFFHSHALFMRQDVTLHIII